MAIRTESAEHGSAGAWRTGLSLPRASRIGDIAALIAAIAAGGAMLIAVMGYQNAAMQEKITASVSPLQEKITSSVSPLAVAIVEMDKRLTGRLDQVDKRLDRIEQRLDGMGQRVGRLDGKVGN
ncbi:hypothetical protein [Cupriavidus sp. BIS7]|uniref:hypothetical protein n=1 Tax=Cupriavidus sp. BIS7 TaxID=1217718 RepID=UPI0012F64F9F|nr:hypothetical protein [Cupriavidus sp. BIS7]